LIFSQTQVKTGPNQALKGGPKNGYPGYFWDNFGNSAPILTIHLTVTSRNLWHVNMKFFHSPHLYCVTTIPSKTNTTANIGVKCLYFSHNVMVSVGVSRVGKTRVVFIDSGANVYISYYCNIVLEEGLLPHIRPICRHHRWTLQ